jgi:hypothetical protein
VLLDGTLSPLVLDHQVFSMLEAWREAASPMGGVATHTLVDVRGNAAALRRKAKTIGAGLTAAPTVIVITDAVRDWTSLVDMVSDADVQRMVVVAPFTATRCIIASTLEVDPPVAQPQGRAVVAPATPAAILTYLPDHLLFRPVLSQLDNADARLLVGITSDW